MPSGNGTAYRVSHFPVAEDQIRELWRRAVQRGVEHDLAQILVRATTILGTRPLSWGETTYHPKKQGSVVCLGAVGGLIFEYVVYENERVVMILNVNPMPGSHWNS